MNIESVNVSICLFSLCVSIRSVAPNSKECWWYLPLQNCHVGKKHLISSYPPYSTIFHHNIYPWHICLKQCHHTLGDSSCWFTTTRIGEMASAGSRGRALGVFTYRKMWKTPCGPPRKIVYKWLIFHIYVGLPYRVTPNLNCEYSRKLNVMFVFSPKGQRSHWSFGTPLTWTSWDGWVAEWLLWFWVPCSSRSFHTSSNLLKKDGVFHYILPEEWHSYLCKRFWGYVVGKNTSPLP